jgi:indole-3-glycerol phosphate synthase
LDALLDRAHTLGLFVLLEAFDAGDIELMHEIVDQHAVRAHADSADATRAPSASAVELLAGVNCRDLTTLQIVPPRLIELAHLLPTRVPRVAESGVGSAEDARRVAAAGYELALVGSALMQGGDPGALANAMLQAGRAARSSSHPGLAPGQDGTRFG